jgi:hypothetical protein
MTNNDLQMIHRKLEILSKTNPTENQG